MLKQRSLKGALNEFLGLIFFTVILLGMLIPVTVEILAYTGQAQEVDRLTKAAAKKACSLQANSNAGIAGDLRQSNLGVATNVEIMQRIVNSVIVNEASNPQSYLANTQDGENIDLRLYNMLGEEINIRDKSQNNPFSIEITGSTGRKDRNVRVGTNAEGSLCPSGGGQDWRYCMDEANDDATLMALMNTGANPLDNSDLVQRMQRLQAGRCLPNNPNCRNDFRGRLDRCTVCTTKTRQSIFSRTMFGNVFGCDSAQTQRILPCSITTCATEKFVQVSAKRGYNTVYQNASRLGEQFDAREIHPNSPIQSREILPERTRVQDAFINGSGDMPTNQARYQKVPEQQFGEDTVRFYGNMDSQFGEGE